MEVLRLICWQSLQQCSYCSCNWQLLVVSIRHAWSLNIIEYSFFLNLGILASATTVTTWGQKAVVYTSASIAFALFILIVVFHTVTKLKSSQLCNWISLNITRKVQVKLSKLRSTLRKLCHKWRSTQPSTQPGVSHFSVELRESLLESHDCSERNF